MALALIRFPLLVRIHIGPLAASPHGIGIAVGFLLGARLMLPAAEKRGISRDQASELLTRAAFGAVVGARLAYVLNHGGDYVADPVAIIKVWEGGISLLGGIAGAILAALPRMRAERLPFWKVMDAAAPGLALGIAVGRVGDLIVGDHLGKPTRSVIGFACRGVNAASPCAAGVGEGVHLPALYDLVSVSGLLVFLLWLRRRPRRDGFLILTFAAWYGTGRLVEDFFRVDVTHGTGLTGSQWASVALILSVAIYAFRRRGGSDDASVLVLHDRANADGLGNRTEE
ncbi:MAG TPA: prolipoprotein diacylglyceryl transferase [Acidimicrobiales bacterium]|nr:prolipoprotein diacylglyceryl transferase [Acidimicrobiales bacterium]